MKLEFYPLEKLKKEILAIIGNYLDLKKYRVFFFGSRVDGGSDEYSDIDVGIEGQKEIPIKIKADIEEEIENLPILYKIDLVDFKNVTSKFKEVVGKKIEVIN